MYKSRKYFILDRKPLEPDSELLLSLRPGDTALFNEIIKKGQRSDDFVNFFRQKGISIKSIDFDQFLDLPPDSVILTKREIQLKRKYDKLWEQEVALVIEEKSHESADKALSEKRNLELHNKLLTRNPYLFIMYPIYKYDGYTLVMFNLKACRACEIVFKYEICALDRN